MVVTAGCDEWLGALDKPFLTYWTDEKRCSLIAARE
jgi:hypothetical protein